ncbi:MarR family winged helix-turn-helix transcriptional regulator [Paenibacillus sp. GYB003]|uniref:MarR family winged helix-turn-helix transcriptional regulator n=1 Tax=Paenibacillus sp. GYB003 TaxID=2994392 RepID=UPI002F967EAC
MSDKLQHIAKLLMESFIQSRGNSMQQRAIYNQKPGEAMVLYFISENVKDGEPGLKVSDISGKLNVTSPTVSQHINHLEAQGFVERHADSADRRVVRIRLTDAGKAYIQRINEARLDMFVGLVNHLGEEESLRLVGTLRKADDYIRKRQEQLLKVTADENEEI